MPVISGPINWVEINCPHQKQAGSFAPSILHRAGNDSSYKPRFDYGGGTVDSGNTPASRTQASVSTSTSVTISYCTFAQGDINVSNMRFTSTGVKKLLDTLATGNVASVRYDLQSGHCSADTLATGSSAPSVPASDAVAKAWSLLAGKGFTRTGTYSVEQLVFSVQTTTTNETFTCPFSASVTAYQLDIDWGDGSVTTEYTNGTDTRKTHTYALGGTYTIKIVGTVMQVSTQGFAFYSGGDRAKVKSLSVIDMTLCPQGLFDGCTNITGSVPKLRDTCVYAAGLVSGCTGITSLGNFTMPSSMINAQQMFDGCTNLTGPFPSIPSGVTTLYGTFRSTKLYGPHPALPAGLQNMNSAFHSCANMTGDIRLQGLSAVTDASAAFQQCTGLTGTITGLSSMTSLTNGSAMFHRCLNLTGSIPALPASLTNMGAMFAGTIGAMNLTGPFPATPASVTAMNGTYQGCTKLTGPAPNIPAAITNLDYTFESCQGMTTMPTLPTGLTTAYVCFSGCTSMAGTFPATLPTGLTNIGGMFQLCGLMTGTVPAMPTGVTNATYTYAGTGASAFTAGTAAFTVNNFTDYIGQAMPNMTAAAVDAFLIWLDTYGPATGSFSYRITSTTASQDASRSPAALTAKNNLIAKGWVRTGTY